MSQGIIMGNVAGMYMLSLTIDPAAVATITTAEQTFTMTGVKVGDMVYTSKPSNTTGVGIVNARVSATDTIAITFVNPTAGSVNPASESWSLLVLRPAGGVAATSISD